MSSAYFQTSGHPINLSHMPQKDRDILNELLERKVGLVPKALRLAHSIDDIGSMSCQYPYKDGVELHEGTTFAAQLRYRGDVLNYIKDGRDFEKWDTKVLTSYFISNVDNHRSFDIYFEQTKSRLFDDLTAFFSNKATRIQNAYILACLEAAKFSDEEFENRPTECRNRFIQVFQEDPTQFRYYGHKKCKDNKQKAIEHVNMSAYKWNRMMDERSGPPGEFELKAMRILRTLCGKHLTYDANTFKFSGMGTVGGEEQPKKRPPRKRKTKARWKVAEKMDVVQEPKAPPSSDISKQVQPRHEGRLMLNLAPYKDMICASSVLAGLIAPFPGWSPQPQSLNDLRDDPKTGEEDFTNFQVVAAKAYNDGTHDGDDNKEDVGMFGLTNEMGQLDLSLLNLRSLTLGSGKTHTDVDQDSEPEDSARFKRRKLG